jgi:hypothetical protein
MTPATTGPVLDADSELEREPALGRVGARHLEHREAHSDHAFGMIGQWVWNPAGRHIGVSDRLDLGDAVAIGEFVEPPEQDVEHFDGGYG